MWEEYTDLQVTPSRVTGYVFEELMMWHSAGTLSFDKWVEPLESWESPATKSRINGLVEVSGLVRYMKRIHTRRATKTELMRFHTEKYIDEVKAMSNKDGGNAGEVCRFGPGGFEIALTSAGGILRAVEAVMADPSSEHHVDNAYCLVRPPGHHAERDRGRGFCIFNNVVLGAYHARHLHASSSGQSICSYRVAVVDYDVHHGNGTQQAFWEDPYALLISIHQDSNYPVGTGTVYETGHAELAPGSIINIPLPPGSGFGAYEYAFHTVVIPALHRFQPDIILVSSGFDASYADCLASMMLSSESYRWMTRQLMQAADTLCGGRLVFAHEGGYSKDYVPFCGLAVMEELCGIKTPVEDSYLCEVSRWGYQSLQDHQRAVVDAVCAVAGLAYPSGGDPPGDEMDVATMCEDGRAAARAISVLLKGLTTQESRKAVLGAAAKQIDEHLT